MILDFERGSQNAPKGHALAYVRHTGAPDEVYATYIIVPPVSIDLAKYMPPMFSDKVSLADLESISAVPLPPVPERVESHVYLRRLAERREDDVIFLGAMDATDSRGMLAQVAEASQEYLRVYTVYVESVPKEAAGETSRIGDSVADVMYGLLGEGDKLGELAKLLGKVRYAVEGGDASLEEEAVQEMQALGGHLSEKYRVDLVAAAARIHGEKGQRLSQLHIERCYKLCDEDYRAVEHLEREIQELESQP